MTAQYTGMFSNAWKSLPLATFWTLNCPVFHACQPSEHSTAIPPGSELARFHSPSVWWLLWWQELSHLFQTAEENKLHRSRCCIFFFRVWDTEIDTEIDRLNRSRVIFVCDSSTCPQNNLLVFNLFTLANMYCVSYQYNRTLFKISWYLTSCRRLTAVKQSSRISYNPDCQL